MAGQKAGYAASRSTRYKRMVGVMKRSSIAYSKQGGYQHRELSFDKEDIEKGVPYIHSNISSFTNTYNKIVGDISSAIDYLVNTKNNLISANQKILTALEKETALLKQVGLTPDFFMDVQNNTSNEQTINESFYDALQNIREILYGKKKNKDDGDQQVKDIQKAVSEAISVAEETMTKLTEQDIDELKRQIQELLSVKEKISGKKYEKDEYARLSLGVASAVGFAFEYAFKGVVSDGLEKIAKTIDGKKIILDSSGSIAFSGINTMGRKEDLGDVKISLDFLDNEKLNKKFSEIAFNIKSNKNYYTSGDGKTTFNVTQTFKNDNTFFKNLRLVEYVFWNQISLSNYAVAQRTNEKTDKILKMSANRKIANKMTPSVISSNIQTVYALMSMYKRLIDNADGANTKSADEQVAFLEDKSKNILAIDKSIVPMFVVLGSRILYTSEVYNKILNMLKTDTGQLKRQTPSTLNLTQEGLARLYKTKQEALLPPKEYRKPGRPKKGEVRTKPAVERSYKTIIRNADFQNQLMTLIISAERYHFLTGERKFNFSFKI